MAKNVYKNGTEFIHKETKKRVRFLKWLDDATANCIDKEMNFMQLTREDLDQNYQSVSAMNKSINERRRNQMWSY
jgi:hypothetical protein